AAHGSYTLSLHDALPILEGRAKRQTTAAIQALQALRPATARIRFHQQEKEIPIEQVQVNDLIIVKPGERIPVDGVIVEGSSHARLEEHTSELQSRENLVC